MIASDQSAWQLYTVLVAPIRLPKGTTQHAVDLGLLELLRRLHIQYLKALELVHVRDHEAHRARRQIHVVRRGIEHDYRHLLWPTDLGRPKKCASSIDIA